MSQYIANVSTRELHAVDWPGYPSLFENEQGQIVQLVVYRPDLGAWMRIVPQASPAVEPGVVEVTLSEWLATVPREIFAWCGYGG